MYSTDKHTPIRQQTFMGYCKYGLQRCAGSQPRYSESTLKSKSGILHRALNRTALIYNLDGKRSVHKQYTGKDVERAVVAKHVGNNAGKRVNDKAGNRGNQLNPFQQFHVLVLVCQIGRPDGVAHGANGVAAQRH